MRDNIDGHFLLIGLMAYPIRHSLSPQMQNTIYSKLNVPYVYLAFEVDQEKLPGAIKGLRRSEERRVGKECKSRW